MSFAYNRIPLTRTGDTLYDNLFFTTVFVWAKLNVGVCLVVFLVSLVAQWAVRSPVNVSVKEGNFPVF